MRSHFAFRTWLFRHPDPELFDRITHPDCECYNQERLLAIYVERGWRWTGEGPGTVVNQVEVFDDQARDVVLLKVVLQHPETTELIDEIRSELTGTR